MQTLSGSEILRKVNKPLKVMQTPSGPNFAVSFLCFQYIHIYNTKYVCACINTITINSPRIHLKLGFRVFMWACIKIYKQLKVTQTLSGSEKIRSTFFGWISYDVNTYIYNTLCVCVLIYNKFTTNSPQKSAPCVFAGLHYLQCL